MVKKEKHIKPGYQLTEVGIIPIDWQVDTLKNNLKSSPRYGIGAAAVDYSFQLPKYLRITDISDDGYYLPEKMVSVDHPFAENYYLTDGDIVVARTGASVGKSYLYNRDDGALVFAGFLICLKTDEEKLIPQFLKNYLQTPIYWNWVKVTSVRSGQPGINGNEYASLNIPLPSKPEQSKIAQALSDTDTLIASLDKLIEKKKSIKQGAMQGLLTGKKRLPGFNGEWGEKRLIEIVNFYDNLRLPVSESKREYGKIPYYGANGIQSYTKGYTHDGEFVLIAEDGANDLNDYPILYVNGKIWVNNHAHVIQGINKKASTKYLSYALKTINFIQVLVGGTRAKLNGSVAKAIMIKIPFDINEQYSIAQVLSDMDSEISELQKKRDKYKQIKNGMMSELLTGNIRLLGVK